MGTDGGITTTQGAQIVPMTISPVDSTSSWPFPVDADQVQEAEGNSNTTLDSGLASVSFCCFSSTDKEQNWLMCTQSPPSRKTFQVEGRP